jgi:hypothetical protein
MSDPEAPVVAKKQRGDYADSWAHITPKYLIKSTEYYVVFIDDEGDIDWETSPKYDSKGHDDLRKHNAITNGAALLEVTPCDGLRADMKLHFKRLIAEGIVCSFDHDYENAEKMLKAAESYILARGQETSRLWYLSSSFGMAVPFIVVGLETWLWRDAFMHSFGPGALWLCMAAVAGSLGALLSVIGRTGKLNLDCAAGRWLHYMEGASRIWAGAISGMVVAIAIRTEMILAPLSRVEKLPAVTMLAALAAGAAERFAASIISTISAASTETASQKTPIDAKKGPMSRPPK